MWFEDASAKLLGWIGCCGCLVPPLHNHNRDFRNQTKNRIVLADDGRIEALTAASKAIRPKSVKKRAPEVA
jgi:hypothetical protein